jgi:hypothetical protein
MTEIHQRFYCLPLVDPDIARLFTYCHVAIALSYLIISLYILVFAHGRGISFLPRRWLDNAFAVFIVGCGATHAFAAYSMWNGSRSIALAELSVLGITGVASLLTAGAVHLYRRELGRPPSDQLAMDQVRVLAKEQGIEDTINLVSTKDPDLGITLRAHFDLRTQVHLREAGG